MQTMKQHSSGNFFQTLWGFALVVMVVAGICGTIYKLLAPSGWIAALMGHGFSGGVARNARVIPSLLMASGVQGIVKGPWAFSGCEREGDSARCSSSWTTILRETAGRG